jgi:hypothetical protein
MKSFEILTGFSILVRMFRRSIQCYTYGGECRLVQYMQVNVAMARGNNDGADLYVPKTCNYTLIKIDTVIKITYGTRLLMFSILKNL